MSNRSDAEILRGLSGDDAEIAWAEFLEAHSPLIYQVARQFDRDEDRLADCHLYVCDRLHRDRFRRLKRFRLEGRASFSTWLRVVVRNLSLDWRRQALGSPRLFRAISRRSPVEQEVFRCIYRQGMTLDETLGALRAAYPGLDGQQVGEIVTSLHEQLSGRQFWLMSSRRPSIRSLSATSSDSAVALEERVADALPDPEENAQASEQRAALAEALSLLPPSERLVLRLRYLSDLPLREVARLADLDGPQAAARHVEKALSHLRERLKAPR